MVTEREDQLITYSLGSCVGLTLHDARAGVGGLAHCVYPSSRSGAEGDGTKPCFYTDAGILRLLEAVCAMGARKDRLVAKVAGAANMHESMSHLEIGKRNHVVLSRVLWKNDILIASEDVGGTSPKTLILDMRTGRTLVKTSLESREL